MLGPESVNPYLLNFIYTVMGTVYYNTHGLQQMYVNTCRKYENCKYTKSGASLLNY